MELLAIHTCDSRHGGESDWPTVYDSGSRGELPTGSPNPGYLSQRQPRLRGKIRPAGNVNQNDSLRVHYKRPVRINRSGMLQLWSASHDA